MLPSNVALAKKHYYFIYLRNKEGIISLMIIVNKWVSQSLMKNNFSYIFIGVSISHMIGLVPETFCIEWLIAVSITAQCSLSVWEDFETLAMVQGFLYLY